MPFLEELRDRLVAQSVGVYGSTIFLGSGADLPKLGDTRGKGPFISMVETGGTAPTRIHNQSSANTQRPSASIIARGVSSQTTRAMAKAAYDALDGIFNTTLSGTFYQSVTAQQEPTDIGLDTEGRRMFSFNVRAEKAPS